MVYTGNPVKVHYSFSFKESDNTITLLADGRLKVESFNTFTDGSGRGDYTSVDYFVKAPETNYLRYR